MYLIWEKCLFDLEINIDLGHSSVEIDESKAISSGHEIYWKFHIFGLNTKKARVDCVLTDLTIKDFYP